MMWIWSVVKWMTYWQSHPHCLAVLFFTMSHCPVSIILSEPQLNGIGYVWIVFFLDFHFPVSSKILLYFTALLKSESSESLFYSNLLLFAKALPVASGFQSISSRSELPKETRIPLIKYLTTIKSSHSFFYYQPLFVLSFLLHRPLAQMPHL